MMMMRLKHISLYLACMIVLLHAVVPHHHHPNKPICIHQLNHNDCDNHDNCCDFGDEENHHHDFDKAKCIIDDYFTPKDNNDNDIKTYVRMSLHENPFDLNFITEVINSFHKENGNVFRRSDQTIIYKDPLATNNFALRAPPTC